MDGDKGNKDINAKRTNIFQNILKYKTDNVTFFLQRTISPNTSMHVI